MSHLSKLKIVAQAAKRQQSKTEHRRGKLLEKLDDQLAMVQALIEGETFTRIRLPAAARLALPGGLDATTSSADISGLLCGPKVRVALSTSSDASQVSAGSASSAVALTSSTLSVCPGYPMLSVSGQPVTVRIVGAKPKADSVSTGVAKLNVSGATVNIPVDADGFGTFTYTPAAGGRAKVTASYASLNQKTNRLSTATATGYVWTANIRVPRTATVGKAFTVKATYVTPGETLTLHTPTGDTSATADASGNVTLTGTFDQVGLQTATILWGSRVLSTNSIAAAQGR